jgi:hypothetical protein
MSRFKAFWLSDASTAAEGELGGGGSVGGGGWGGGGEGEVATRVSGGFTDDTFTPSMLERDATELSFSSLNAFVAVAAEIVVIVKVIVLPASRLVRRSPVRLLRVVESLSCIASKGTPNSMARAKRMAVSLYGCVSSIVTEDVT